MRYFSGIRFQTSTCELKYAMKVIRHLTHSPKQRCVATIGNFDGFHKGHQTVLQQLRFSAKALQLPTTIIIFEPQPQEFLNPGQAPARLTRLREKLAVIQHHHPVDKVLCLRFDAKFAAMSAQNFIEQILVNGLAVQHLVVGDDFHFGQGRQGNFTTLQQAGQHYGFSVEKWQTFILEGERVSSTRVRQMLTEGNMIKVQELLGRPYTICGRVSYGQQRGRTIGFPTANLLLHRLSSPLYGVFAVKVHRLRNIPLPAVANLGTRPTVDGKHLFLEVHLFDFHESIYGYPIEIEFVHKLRDEKKFTSLHALKEQIQQDVTHARTLLQNQSP